MHSNERWGGLLTVRNKKLRNSLTLMAAQAFTSSSVYIKKIISSSQYETGPKQPYVAMNAISDHTAGLRRDLQICHIWQHQTDTIIYIRVTDTDTKTYISCPLENVL